LCKGGTPELETLDLVRDVLTVIEDKKGSDILVLDIREISLLADCFVICTAETSRQLKAIADSLIPEMKNRGLLALGGTEGSLDSGWVLVDFGDIVVHLFSPQQRDFYALDKLWKDAKVVVHIQ
jgi:ribosome-associated protein